MWNKRDYVRRSECVVAQVDAGLIRTGGDNLIHVSEFDAIVEYEQPPLDLPEPPVPEGALAIFENVAELVRDG